MLFFVFLLLVCEVVVVVFILYVSIRRFREVERYSLWGVELVCRFWVCFSGLRLGLISFLFVLGGYMCFRKDGFNLFFEFLEYSWVGVVL